MEITNKSVHIALARRFQDYVLVVIISHCSGHFFIVHLWLVFPHPPSNSNLIRVIHLELPAVPGPGDDAEAGLVGEELQQELPQLDGTRAREAGTSRGLGYDGSLDQGPGGGGLQTGGGGGLSLEEGRMMVHGNVAGLERL